jgi:RES domain
LSPDLGVPAAPDPRKLNPLIAVWPAGKQIVRCHSSVYGATEFNRRISTPGRFRPIRAGKRAVGTLYGASEPAGAVSETVFHDIPVEAAVKRVRMTRFDTVVLSTLAPKRELRFISLHGIGFHRVGANRTVLIDSEASEYSALSAWGQALHDAAAEADGIQWRSRQFDDAYACLLFGDRVRRKDLDVVAPSLPLVVGRGLELVEQLAEQAGITLVA